MCCVVGFGNGKMSILEALMIDVVVAVVTVMDLFPWSGVDVGR